MKLRLLLALFIVQLGFAQQRTCGMEEHMRQMMFNPVLKKQYEERQAKFEAEYQRLLANQQMRTSSEAQSPDVVITIPVAVHFPSVPNSTPEATKALYRNFAQTQITIINNDYNATNSDISNWSSASSFYPGVNVGDLDLNFVIATQNHPASTGLANGVKAVTFGTDFLAGADNDLTWAGYMNFVIRDLGSGLLGYSPLAGSPSSGATVVMNTWCYGSGTGVPGTPYVPAAPFNLGRTVTHELGHFFNLDHTFGHGNGCNATNTDNVADTPKVGAESYGCPANGSVAGCTAPQKALTMNYMDYVDDACMYMFTAGQATRALAYINTIVGEFKPNVLSNSSFVSSDFSVYPNPNNGSFSIQLKEVTDNYTVIIVDTLGREIYNKEFNQTSDLVQNIQIENALSGLYFVTIQSNGATSTKKILVE